MAKNINNDKKLVIVESPAKAKTINKILGKEFKVAASIGHIIDLPKTKLGVDIENDFRPDYVTIKGKGKIISELKKQATQATEIVLATDPDREGEAIASHIANALSKTNGHISRIEFNEITEEAVRRAINHPRHIDKLRVNAQQARRIMDRIVGYQVSPILWETIYRGLSAGRVQSVALRLLTEREEEIESFTPVEYWTIDAILETEKKNRFKTRLVKINGKTLTPAGFRITSKEEAAQHEKNLNGEKYIVSDIEKRKIRKTPAPPYITSTLQQEASRKFRMTTSRVMSVAQQLYEGVNLGTKGNVGLITYMRTDSTRISGNAVNKCRDYITQSYGTSYLPSKPNFYGRKKAAQDAHESIRPTYINTDFEPKKLKKYLSADQYKIYELIWRRFIACQMKPAEVDKTVVLIDAGPYTFKAEGEIITFRGFMIVYQESQEEQEDQDQNIEVIPEELKKSDVLSLHDLLVEQKFTQPPPRYTESTLVKTLDRLDIGRPSTYSQIISTLFQRKYVERISRAIQPTELGITVVKLLVEHFPGIFNVKFTAHMEDSLDKIEQGKAGYLETLNDFYEPFNESLQKVHHQKSAIKKGLVEETDIQCDRCGRPMVLRWGRNGRFYACSGYPSCKNTKPYEEPETRMSDEKCELCGSPMAVKRGRFGEFLACSNYPECKNTRPISTGVSCPRDHCDGQIVQRQSKKGKIFYSCSNYPKCEFALWDKPVNKPCPQCDYPFLVEKLSRSKSTVYQCPQCKFKIAEN